MQTTYSSAGAGPANEDYAVCGNNWAVIFDGATAPAHIDSGCVHDVPWLVHKFAAALAPRMVDQTELPLSDLMAGSIEDVCQLHASTCDLSNPDSPSTTVSVVRISEGSLDYLTLGDSPIVLWQPDGGAEVFLDDRVAHLPGGRPYTYELVRSCRNQPGGFWVASTNPEAAYQAVQGTLSLAPNAEIGLFTDGATRLVDFYGYSWDELFALLRRLGPAGLIASVRDMECRQPLPDGKKHDDATAVHLASA